MHEEDVLGGLQAACVRVRDVSKRARSGRDGWIGGLWVVALRWRKLRVRVLAVVCRVSVRRMGVCRMGCLVLP